MNQDDILRELELLPVWQLRAPTIKASEEATAEVAPIAEVSAVLPITKVASPEPELNVVEQKPAPSVISEPAVSEAALPSVAFRCIVSDDAQWLFVLQQQQSGEAEALLQNIMKAVAVKVGQNVEQADAAALTQFASKVIVVMGEAEAQQLLTATDSLAALRGYPHELNDTPLIVTYSPEALLENLADKSNAWEDLCLAKFTIANL
ncbi:MAG: hypothetical protein ACI8PW_000895 [Methylophilaceae bacterium]|jgi:hypothetical protein